MASSKENVGGGIGFFAILGLIFITLKLCGVIDWWWIWVLAPLWGPFALSVLACLFFGFIALFMFLIALIIGMTEEIKKRKKK